MQPLRTTLVAGVVVVALPATSGPVREAAAAASTGSWQVVAGTTVPPRMTGGMSALAYDSGRHQLVGMGAAYPAVCQSPSTCVPSTYFWVSGDGGVTWSQTGPAYQASNLVFDARVGMVLTMTQCGQRDLPCLVGWNGSSWVDVGGTRTPMAAQPALADDGRRLYLYGGIEEPLTGAPSLLTYTFDSTGWHLLRTLHNPGPQSTTLNAMTWDPAIGGLVLVDTGAGVTTCAGCTWEFRNGDWSKARSAVLPDGPGAVGYDAADRLVLCNTHHATYAWDGSTWTAQPQAGTVDQSAPVTLSAGARPVIASALDGGSGVPPGVAAWTYP